MRKSLVPTLVALLLNAFFNTATAKDLTPLEAQVMRVKQAHTFTNVAGVWAADRNFDTKALNEMVDGASPLTIDYNRVSSLMKDKSLAINLEIPTLNGDKYTIELVKYDIFSSDFQVHTLGENNKNELFSYTPGLYYSGVVKGIPGSVATFSFFNNEVYGIFSIPGEGNYNVVPNTMVGNSYDYNQHYLLFNDNNLKIKHLAPKCSTDELPEIPEVKGKTTTTLNNNVYNNCTEIRVMEVGDYAMYLRRGSSVTNVTNFLTSVFNNQATIYRNEGIIIVLKYLQVNTATDNYQNITVAQSSRFLDTFGKVTQNVLHGCDLAILASNALNNGSGNTMGGVAWLKAMCTSYNSSNFFGPYGFCNLNNATTATSFPAYSWNVMVMAHEMGHMVGSPHTHRCCWNPSGTGNTAIDGCTTLEGSCAIPSPANPPGGGTIMSYCHLTSVGINLSNGFGQQPGDTIRYYIRNKFSSSCGEKYLPSAALASANKTLTANRECTDLTSGYTYYWYDNNTASQADDTLVLMIKKNGNNIGNLNSTGFSVITGSDAGYGVGSADTIRFPMGTMATGLWGRNMAMHRYWKVTPTTNPTTNVEVMFPFTAKDSSDVDGSVPGVALLTKFKFYKTKPAIDPHPANGFPGAIPSDFSFYSYGTTASATEWSLTTTGTTKFANMLMTNLSGGGTGFYSYLGTAIENVNEGKAGIFVYPNPTNESWNISIEKANDEDMNFQLFSVDGKLVHTQSLAANTVNSIPAGHLAAGVYYYRIVGSTATYTGNMSKQ